MTRIYKANNNLCYVYVHIYTNSNLYICTQYLQKFIRRCVSQTPHPQRESSSWVTKGYKVKVTMLLMSYEISCSQVQVLGYTSYMKGVSSTSNATSKF